MSELRVRERGASGRSGPSGAAVHHNNTSCCVAAAAARADNTQPLTPTHSHNTILCFPQQLYRYSVQYHLAVIVSVMLVMWLILAMLCLLPYTPVAPATTPSPAIHVQKDVNVSREAVAAVEKKVSERVMEILEHYKQQDPVGLPGSPVPDPMPIPDMKHSFSLATMNFMNAQVEGLSKFRIQYIKSNIADMQVAIGLSIDTMVIRGKYRMSTWVSRSAGDFNVTLTSVSVHGLASLEVNRNGQLEAQNIDMDITFQSIKVNFQNLGYMMSIFQGIVNSVGSFLFENVKPLILSEINTNVRGDVNKHIMDIPQRFPNSIPPLDMAVAELRKYVRNMGYDPYRMGEYNHTSGVVTVYLRNNWVTGLASFYRVGNVTVAMVNNTVHVQTHVGSQRVRGSCLWEVELASYISKAGSAAFTVDYVQVDATVAQSLDVRKRPKLEDMDLVVGNIQVRVDGAGTMDYVLEALVNILPNVLRYQIVDALENPIKQRIQATLDEIDVEQLVHEHLPMVDQMNIVPEKKQS